MTTPPRRPRTVLSRRGDPSENCPHCREGYVYELELRCVECDGPMCPLCVVQVKGAVGHICPVCHAEVS